MSCYPAQSLVPAIQAQFPRYWRSATIKIQGPVQKPPKAKELGARLKMPVACSMQLLKWHKSSKSFATLPTYWMARRNHVSGVLHLQHPKMSLWISDWALPNSKQVMSGVPYCLKTKYRSRTKTMLARFHRLFCGHLPQRFDGFSVGLAGTIAARGPGGWSRVLWQ